MTVAVHVGNTASTCNLKPGSCLGRGKDPCILPRERVKNANEIK